MADSPSNIVRVALADDHPMVRQIVASACADHPGLELVAEASTGMEAIAICRDHTPDVLVLDLALPDMSGFEVARLVKEENALIKVLVLSARDDAEAVFETLRVQADGYLDKTSDTDVITAAIEAVAQGDEIYTDEHRQLASGKLREVFDRARTALSQRELEALSLISEGLTTRQIATRLELSEGTVESHIKSLYRKLGVGSRTQATARARELGITTSHTPPI